MLIELEHINGQSIYVNTAHITMVTPIPEGAVITLTGDIETRVAHEPKEIYEHIQQLNDLIMEFE